MYVLAMVGSTQIGNGGTSFDTMTAGVSQLIHAYGRRLDSETGSVNIQNLSKKIDQGLPLMWGMFIVDKLNTDLTSRATARAAVTDWAAYKKSLEPKRNAAKSIVTKVKDDHGVAINNGHMCMIIGYNSKTNEIAISDSWGPEFGERWITVEEAQAISQGAFYTVSW
jgi:hypothetical protein